jgi:hypothetical protein
MAWVKWKLVSDRSEIVLISTQDRSTVEPNVPWARKSFQAYSMVLLGDIGQEEACFGPFGESVNLGAR